MRPVLGLTIAALLLGGCIRGHGCEDDSRANVWRQAELWDWRPADGADVELFDTAAAFGPPWPQAPADWQGNSSVRRVEKSLGGDAALSAGQIGSRGFHTSAVFPAGMDADRRERELRGFLEDVLDPANTDVEAVFQAMWASEGGRDGGGRSLRAEIANASLDPQRFGAGLDWEASPERPGHWTLESGEWTVLVDLDYRVVRGPAGDLVVDAAGLAMGPYFDAALSTDELRENTTRVVLAAGMPAPTFAEGTTLAQEICV